MNKSQLSQEEYYNNKFIPFLDQLIDHPDFKNLTFNKLSNEEKDNFLVHTIEYDSYDSDEFEFLNEASDEDRQQVLLYIIKCIGFSNSAPDVAKHKAAYCLDSIREIAMKHYKKRMNKMLQKHIDDNYFNDYQDAGFYQIEDSINGEKIWVS